MDIQGDIKQSIIADISLHGGVPATQNERRSKASHKENVKTSIQSMCELWKLWKLQKLSGKVLSRKQKL